MLVARAPMRVCHATDVRSTFSTLSFLPSQVVLPLPRKPRCAQASFSPSYLPSPSPSSRPLSAARNVWTTLLSSVHIPRSRIIRSSSFFILFANVLVYPSSSERASFDIPSRSRLVSFRGFSTASIDLPSRSLSRYTGSSASRSLPSGASNALARALGSSSHNLFYIILFLQHPPPRSATASGAGPCVSQCRERRKAPANGKSKEARSSSSSSSSVTSVASEAEPGRSE